MEENTSKVLVAGDANLAAAALMSASGAGSSLFVINLCASMAPIANVAKALPGFESHRLYQVARREDGRTRYRLRLGFFTSQAEAEAVLNTVRSSYPTAFTACLCDEDRKFARGYIAEPPAPPKIAVVVENKHVAKPAAPAPAVPARTATAPKPAAAKPAAPPAAPAKPQTPAKPVIADDTGTTNRMKALPSATAKPAAKAPSQPAAPQAPVEIELSWDPPELQAPPAKANAPTPQVVAPSFKTQDVIKAPSQTPKPAQAATPKPAAAAPPKPAANKPREEAKTPPRPIEAPSKLLAAIELTLESSPAPAPKAAPPATPSSEPFRVGKGVEIPATSLTLESTQTTRALQAKPAAPAPTAAAKPTADASKMKTAQAIAPAAIKAAVVPPAQKPGAKLPDLDSTQTIRALTSAELESESQEKWFAIQLAVSDQPVNLDAMPRLDIFEAYRLYSVASAGSGKITHSLRIGFFREETSAEAVSGYLKTFFAAPSVVRISIAEQARFKDPPAQKPAPKADVLDLSHARDRGPKAVPTVTMEVDKPRFDPNATGRFKTSATGTHRALSTGAHNALSATGTHRALGATGTHKALKPAAKAAPPATKRSAPVSKANMTGKHKALQPKKTLAQQLLDEAREVELSQSGIRKLPKNDSLLSKMFGRKK